MLSYSISACTHTVQNEPRSADKVHKYGSLSSRRRYVVVGWVVVVKWRSLHNTRDQKASLKAYLIHLVVLVHTLRLYRVAAAFVVHQL